MESNLAPKYQLIQNSLNQIHALLDQSEKKGIGTMKSFSSLTKGELLTLQIVNDLTIGAVFLG